MIRVSEGVECWQEAIEALSTQPSLEPLVFLPQGDNPMQTICDTPLTNGLAIVMTVFLGNGKPGRLGRIAMQNAKFKCLGCHTDEAKSVLQYSDVY